MKKTSYGYLILIGTLILILSACTQSTPESPREAVGAITSLAGTSWEVESFGGPDDSVPVIAGSRLSVNYLVERYAGYGGCNWFLGVYGMDGSQVRMETAATTTLNCDSEGITEQEQTFMAALLNVAYYKNQDNKMVGYTAENQAASSPISPCRFYP